MTNPKTNKRVPNSNSSLLGFDEKRKNKQGNYDLVQFLLILIKMDEQQKEWAKEKG